MGLSSLLDQIRFYGKRGNVAPPQGFDENHPIIADILNRLAPLTKPLVDIGAKAREVAPGLAATFPPIQAIPPEMGPAVQSGVQKGIESGGELAGQMTTPLNIAAAAAGGVGGMATGGLRTGIQAAGYAGLVPPAMDMAESGDPTGLVMGALPLAVLVRNPLLAEKYPQQAYKSIADTLNELPPYLTREHLGDLTQSGLSGSPTIPANLVGGVLKENLKFQPQAKSLRDAMDLTGGPISDTLWGLRMYIHGGDGLESMKEASRAYLSGNSMSELYSKGLTDKYRFMGVGPMQSRVMSPSQAADLVPHIIETIKSATPRDVRLFRGLGTPPSNEKIMNEAFTELRLAQSGDVIDMNELSSFSHGQGISRNFGPVIILETTGPIKALNVSALNRYVEGEHLTFGKFEVVSSEASPVVNVSKIKANVYERPPVYTEGKFSLNRINFLHSIQRITIRQIEP